MSQTSPVTLGTIHNLIARLSPLRASVLAFVCGVITLFGFAPFHFWPVIVIAISLMVWIIDGARIREKWRLAVFLRGWAFGAGFTLSSMHWMVSPFLVEPEKHLIFIWMPLILLPAGLGLFFGGASLLAGLLWSRTPGRVLIFAACLAISEYLRGVLFGGFPWNWFGTVWEPGAAISQIASLIGLFGLTILTLLMAAAPAALADFRPKGTAFERILPAFLAVIIFGLGWGWGSQRLSSPESDEKLAIRLVDVGVSQKDKYPNGEQERDEAARNILVSYLQAMGDDFPDEPRLVIWPESALPIPLLQNPNAFDATTERLGNRTLIAGTVRVDFTDTTGPKYYNSLAILTRRSQSRGALDIYTKHKLVPFGELAAADFIPFGHSISGILPKSMQQMAESGFTPGTAPRPMELPGGQSFLPLICYEGLFPRLVSDNMGNADFLVNISIDSWFGSQIGPKQHFTNIAYRAIENGRSLVRVANLGETAALDPYGRRTKETRSESTKNDWPVTVVDVEVPVKRINTLFQVTRDMPSWLLILSLILFSCIFRKNRV